MPIAVHGQQAFGMAMLALLAAPDARAQQAAAPTLTYLPWTKFCARSETPQAEKIVCLTVSEAWQTADIKAAGVALIEEHGKAHPLLRTTLPLSFQIKQGARLLVDQAEFASIPSGACTPNSCLADYEADADTVGRMAKGQSLTIAYVNLTGSPVSVSLPLADFAKIHDGPDIEPRAYEEKINKLKDELRQRSGGPH